MSHASLCLWWLPSIFGIPWLLAASDQSPPLSSCGFPPQVSVSSPFLPLIRTFSLDVGPYLLQYDLDLIRTFITTAKTLLSNKVTV